MFGMQPASGAPGAVDRTIVRLVFSRFTLPSTAASVLPWAAGVVAVVDHLLIGGAAGRVCGTGEGTGPVFRGIGRGTVIALGWWSMCSLVGAMTMSWRKSR